MISLTCCCQVEYQTQIENDVFPVLPYSCVKPGGENKNREDLFLPTTFSSHSHSYFTGNSDFCPPSSYMRNIQHSAHWHQIFFLMRQGFQQERLSLVCIGLIVIYFNLFTKFATFFLFVPKKTFIQIRHKMLKMVFASWILLCQSRLLLRSPRPC